MAPASIVDLVLARSDVWAGIYRSGVLVHEDSDITAERLIHEIGHDLFRVLHVKVVRVDRAWLESRGCLPERVSDLKVAA